MRESLEDLTINSANRLEFSNSRLENQLKSSLHSLNLDIATGKLLGAATMDSSKAVKSEANKKKGDTLVEGLLRNQRASARTISSLRFEATPTRTITTEAIHT